METPHADAENPTPQPSPDELLEVALALLRSVVDDFVTQRRRPLAATLKPVMIDRTYGGFDELRLGFRSFKRFLEEAQSRGIVTLTQTTLAGELLVQPVAPGTEQAPVAATTHPATSPAPTPGDYGRSPIPNDLWRCFVDWNPGLKRWYHVPSRMALMFPEEPIPMERPEHIAAREKWRAAPEQCVEIPAISMARQLEWMREFAQGTSDAASRRLLEAALASDRPNSSFSFALRGNHSLWMQWRAFRIERVREALTTWSSANNIVVSLEEVTPPAPPAPKQKAADSGQDTANERALRIKIIQAVERMSIGDLRRLPIPVEYIVDL